MLSRRLTGKLLIIAGVLVAACDAGEAEKIPDSTPASEKVYKEQLAELKEPEGMLEKEKFFAKKAFLEEQSGMIDDAINSFQKAIQLNPKVGLYHFRLAMLYKQQKKYKEAHVYAENAVRIGTNSEDLLLFIAELYLQEKKFSQGLNFILDRFQGLPESEQLLLIRGRLLLGINDTDAGIQDLQRSYELGNPVAKIILAEHYLKNEPQKTLTFIGSEDLKNDALVWIAMQAFLKMGNVDTLQALRSYLHNPDSAQILFLARTYRDINEYGKARLEYEQLISQDSANETAVKELAELERNIAYLQNRRRSTIRDSSIKSDSVNNNE